MSIRLVLFLTSLAGAGLPGAMREALSDELLYQAAEQAISLEAAISESVPAVAECRAEPVRSLNASALESVFKKSGMGMREFASSQSCSSLFAMAPPRALRKLDPAGKLVNADNWFPVCSPLMMNRFRSGEPEPAAIEVLAATKRHFESKDYCALEPSAMRGGSGYVAPTQASWDAYTPSSPEQEKEWKGYAEKNFDRLRDRVAGVCCADGSKACKSLMASVELRWCVPETSRDKSDPCTETGTFFQTDLKPFEAWFDFYKTNPEPGAAKGKFPYSAGYVQLSGLFYADGVTKDDHSTIAHELAHACSSIRRQISANGGNRAAFEDFRNAWYRYDQGGRPSLGCEITPEAKTAFGDLFKGVRADKGTIECYAGVAKVGGKKRFAAGDCDRGCPRQHFEEGFADWMRYEVALEELDVPWLIDVTCDHYVRDNEHPFLGDSFRCALESESLRRRWMKHLGCRK